MFDSSKIIDYLYSAKEKIAHTVGEVFDFWHVRIYLAVSVLLNAVSWGVVFLIRSQAEGNLLILHYNIDFGADLIGRASQLTFVPVLGLVVMVANLLLTFFFMRSDNFNFLSHLLLFTAVAVNLFLLISLAPVYLINF